MPILSLNTDANERFSRGDAITDDELRGLLAFYERSAHMMEQLGAEFKLATNELRNRLYTLQCFQQARRER